MLREQATELLRSVYPFERGVRLLGVSLSGLLLVNDRDTDKQQLSLW